MRHKHGVINIVFNVYQRRKVWIRIEIKITSFWIRYTGLTLSTSPPLKLVYVASCQSSPTLKAAGSPIFLRINYVIFVLEQGYTVRNH